METGPSLFGNDLKKYQFLKTPRERLADHVYDHYTVRVRILSLTLQINVFGPHAQTCYEFLKSHYHAFLFFEESKIDCNLYYFPLEEHLSLADSLWSDRYPSFHLLKEKDQVYLIQRDFMALANPDFTHLCVHGPLLEPGNPDSMDNLLMILFSYYQKKHQTLMLHSAAVAKDGKAYIFFGKSGAGKSTLAFQSFKENGHQIIGSDQTLLRLKEGKLFAQASPTTIPELVKNPEGRTFLEYEVAALVHLDRSLPKGFHKRSLWNLLPRFIEQSFIYQLEENDHQYFLDFSTQILNSPGLHLAELSYEKGEDFWQWQKF